MSRRSMLGGTAAAAAAAAAGPVFGGTAAAAADKPGASGRRYAGKTVLVTGATSGIGRAAAIAFAREGAKVGFCGRRERLGREVEREIRAAGGEATYFKADVRRPKEVEAFVDRVVRTYDGLDIALNNAGIQKPFTDLHEVSVEEWDDVTLTNTRGVFLAMKYEIPHLRRRGGGVILVTGSSNQFQTRAGLGSYTASKNSVTGLVQAAAIENGKHGIRVVSLAPGTTDTPMLEVHRPDGLSDADWEKAKAQIAQGVDAFKRMAKPEEMATAALALASADLGFQTGATVLVDGGQLAGL
ncbi:SDR family NAD(P)-dependent oxidoreductase [Streptomyces boninensis]|uniref:SDR family NAD(P)-dependent oxidoreductase n=1 Tax=Streptomyces boninensis TaxID=2039455 RepID=UPI003B20FAA9